MARFSELQTLYHLLRAPGRAGRGGSHSEWLEQFYARQADNYDNFRKKLLPEREKLFASLSAPKDGVWVDLGGATGANLECIDNLRQLKKVYVVDLSPSLLKKAEERSAKNQWTNVVAVHSDVCEFLPEEGSADIVTFSYSLSMIPRWYLAIDQARRILRPGGKVGVVDFYVSDNSLSGEQRQRHSWWTRTFWPTWFAFDGVRLGPDRLEYLRSHFQTQLLRESTSRLPYVAPLGAVPYYIFVGTKQIV